MVEKGRLEKFIPNLRKLVTARNDLPELAAELPALSSRELTERLMPPIEPVKRPSDEGQKRVSLLPEEGWSEGDETAWYTAQFEKLRPRNTSAATDPILAERCDPHPLFSSAWYARRYAAGTAGMSAVEHYVRRGASSGRVPHPVFEMRRRYGRRVEIVRPTEQDPRAYLTAARSAVDVFFDKAYFKKRYPRIASPGLEPFREFVLQGWGRWLDPHPLFWTEFYCQQVSDPIASSIEAVAHYVLKGADLGYDPHPAFNSRYYISQQSGITENQVNPLWHYLTSSQSLRYRPHPCFDSGRYLQKYSDVAAAQLDPLLHYLAFGAVEGRDLNLPSV